MEEEKKEGDLLLPQERRDYPRVGISVHVKYRVLGDSEEDRHLVKHFDPDKIFTQAGLTKAVNVSTSGLLLYTDEEIQLKKFVAVNMYLPLPGLSSSCKALGEVMRCEKTASGKYTIGIRFLRVIHHDLNKFKFMTLTDLLDIKGEDIKLD